MHHWLTASFFSFTYAVGVLKEDWPSELELNNLAGRVCRQWKTLGLRLGISQDVLDGIDVNEPNDKPYQMLLRWMRTTDSVAPYLDLYSALCDKRVGLDKVAREFCCKKTTGTRHIFLQYWNTQRTTD